MKIKFQKLGSSPKAHDPPEETIVTFLNLNESSSSC
jgi:hypothetical protein